MSRILLLVLIVVSMNGMCKQSDISYRKAIASDISALLHLINHHAIHESDRLVIVPKQFRKMVLQKAVDAGQIFVACRDNQIIGYKKLFVINDSAQKDDILKHELRLQGADSICTTQGVITGSDDFVAHKSVTLEYDDAVCLYTGADFTLDSYRGNGINKELTDNALSLIKPEIVQGLQSHNTRIITLLYGLTQANAGTEIGKSPDRTKSISQSFKDFLASLSQPRDQMRLKHCRCVAFKPSFDSESSELQPLPDDQSISGFGCALSYKLGIYPKISQHPKFILN